MEVPVLNKQGKQVDTLVIDEQTLGGEVNPALIKQAFVRYHANRRQGSARTKNRSMVEGSTRKLYRQKGTGHARPGSARTPIRRGGGHTFHKNKTRESYRLDMPIKMRRKANRNALLAKLIDGEVKVIDDLNFDAPKTAEVRRMLESLGVDRSCLVAVPADNRNAGLGARNLDRVEICNCETMTCFEMLNNRFMVIAKSDLEAWINGPGAKTDKSAKRKEVA
ncbi:MAG: 50S ribosomal protein L4 [Phycisphaerales bacterium]